MKLVDAHIHLSDIEYTTHIDDLIADAKNAGVVALVSNSMDLETSNRTIQLAERFPGLIFPALGIHPWNVNVLEEHELDETLTLISILAKEKCLSAIGEVGLDSKYDEIWNKQLKVFDKMLKLAETLKLPVIVHSRGTTPQILDILPSYNLKRILLHWFSYPISVLSKIISNGYFISEGPPTIYSIGIREIVKQIPLANLLTETDGPVKYYKPPFNGKLTKPSFVYNVIEAISEIKRMGIKDVADQVANNFATFFDIRLD